MNQQTKKKLQHLWRRAVIHGGKEVAVHDPAWAMGVAVLTFVVGAIFTIAGVRLNEFAAGFPPFAKILTAYPWAALALKGVSIFIACYALWLSWRHNCRCLMECYPKFFDIYADEN